ncbi:MAG: putative toxin-antitoxin system toxin component, PIN family [Nitrospirae bacterium]|nr:putative toxin-antitoxin system toxin component, PIN family [Nitrospirota bacterium]MCL5421691.1 putative toxin-antitoxin system toxin component, PIN family [Nitrospirota bacterium]
MKVVFDTNIFISALVIPGGQAEKAISRITEGKDILFMSKPIISEILSVLAKKFSRDSEAISRMAVYLSDLATIVHPAKRINVLADKADNRIIECAVSGKADAIVTGDREMLDLKEYLGIRVISLKEYLSY